MKNRKGFTLIEFVIVMTIIMILITIIFIALDPIRLFHESRNARRWSDLKTIISGVMKYQADYEGEHYDVVANLIPEEYYMIGTCTEGGDIGCGAKETQEVCADLTGIITVDGRYLTEIPRDPLTGSFNKSDYYIMRWANDAITVGACDSEGDGPIGTGPPPRVEISQ